jgi:hypothetical protein
MKPSGYLLVVLCGLAVLVPVGVGGQQANNAEHLTGLNTLAEVRSLTPDDATKGLSVRVRGTVTYFDRDRGLLMIQEESNGVGVRMPTGREGMDFDPQPGQLVEVEGVTGRSRNRPIIRGKAVRLIGQKPMPKPLELNPVAPFGQKAEGLWVRVQGWIPTVTRLGNRISSELIVRPGQSLELVLNGGDSPEANDLVGSKVELVGVYGLKFDGAGQINGARLYVNNLASIKRTRALPITAITDAGATSGKAAVNEPFRIRATVVNHSLGEFLIVRDSSGSLRVPYRGLNYFSSGSLVEVFGFPLQHRPELILTNVTVRLVPADTTNEEPVTSIITPAGANTNLATRHEGHADPQALS